MLKVYLERCVLKDLVYRWISWIKTNWLPYLEILAIVTFLTLSTYYIWQNRQQSTLLPLDAKALEAKQGNERWNGIFIQDQHVGFAVNRTSSLEDGSLLLENRTLMKVVAFDSLQTIVTAGAALTDNSGNLQRFDFFMKSNLATLSVKGEVRQRQIILEILDQNGETKTLDYPIEKPPHVALSLESQIRQMELYVGKEFSMPYFNPLTMMEGEMVMKVVDSEVLDNGEEAWWINSSFNGLESRTLVASNGDTIRQEGGALGISMVRMTAEKAQQLDLEEPVDLIGLSAVPVKGKIKDPRAKTGLTVKVGGVDIEKIAPSLPVQQVNISTKEITITLPDLNEIVDSPIAVPEITDTLKEYLVSTIDIPAEHPDIRAKSEEILLSATSRLDAATRINQFVFDYLEKTSVIGVPNGLTTLKQAQGDCNEHTALFVSLARAAQIPTRIAAGIVFSDRTGPLKQFYYHAWPEVLLKTTEGEDLWLPMDPTFGQVPADATHIKLVEGGLDRQVEIMAFLGKITIEVISDIPASIPQQTDTPLETP